MDENQELKNRIAQVLSEIFSDKYDCVVKLRWEKKGEDHEAEQTPDSGTAASA